MLMTELGWVPGGLRLSLHRVGCFKANWPVEDGRSAEVEGFLCETHSVE